MDAKLKAKWVEALRSGKYEQGRKCLKIDERFCCLGVLLDVDGHQWPNVKWFNGNSDRHPIPVSLRGLSYMESETLTDMNDHGKSFREIADFIEANL